VLSTFENEISNAYSVIVFLSLTHISDSNPLDESIFPIFDSDQRVSIELNIFDWISFRFSWYEIMLLLFTSFTSTNPKNATFNSLKFHFDIKVISSSDNWRMNRLFHALEHFAFVDVDSPCSSCISCLPSSRRRTLSTLESWLKNICVDVELNRIVVSQSIDYHQTNLTEQNWKISLVTHFIIHQSLHLKLHTL
jgi:hypothetical protein